MKLEMVKAKPDQTTVKKKGTTKSDEEVRESQWLGKALRRQQTQNKLQELAEKRKATEKTSKADSEVCFPLFGLKLQLPFG